MSSLPTMLTPAWARRRAWVKIFFRELSSRQSGCSQPPRAKIRVPLMRNTSPFSPSLSISSFCTSRMPNRVRVRSLVRFPERNASSSTCRGWLPYPLGHHRSGFRTVSVSNRTVRVSPACSVTGRRRETAFFGPSSALIRASSVPRTVLSAWLTRVASRAIRARDVSGTRVTT